VDTSSSAREASPGNGAAPYSDLPPVTPFGAEPGRVPAPEPTSAGVMDSIKALWDDLRNMVHDQLELAALETQRAVQSLVTIAVVGLVAVLLIGATWIGMMAALVLGLIQLGLNAIIAVLLTVLVNAAGIAVCALIIKNRSRNLRYPATVESLKPASKRTGATPTLES
jgi:uncharacterized membrane protein YqjE